MDKAQTKAAAQVMLAFAEGQEVQYKSRDGTHFPADWDTLLASCPEWNWRVWDYRVKPEPREWWASIDTNGHPRALWEQKSDAVRYSENKPVLVREVLD